MWVVLSLQCYFGQCWFMFIQNIIFPIFHPAVYMYVVFVLNVSTPPIAALQSLCEVEQSLCAVHHSPQKAFPFPQ